MDEVEIVPRIPNFLESDQTGQEEDVAERVTTVPVATGVVEPTIPGEAKVDDEGNAEGFYQIQYQSKYCCTHINLSLSTKSK